jgi:hypothetical protein
MYLHGIYSYRFEDLLQKYVLNFSMYTGIQPQLDLQRRRVWDPDGQASRGRVRH